MAGESLAEIAGLAVAHAPGGFSHAAAGLQVAQGQRHARAGVKVLRTAAPGLAEAAAQAAFAHVQLIGQVADGNALVRVRQQPAGACSMRAASCGRSRRGLSAGDAADRGVGPLAGSRRSCSCSKASAPACRASSLPGVSGVSGAGWMACQARARAWARVAALTGRQASRRTPLAWRKSWRAAASPK